MDLPFARLLYAESDVVILPCLRRVGIEPPDVVLLYVGEGVGIRLALLSRIRQFWTLSGRFRPLPGFFDAGLRTGWAPRDSADCLLPDVAMTAAHATRQSRADTRRLPQRAGPAILRSLVTWAAAEDPGGRLSESPVLVGLAFQRALHLAAPPGDTPLPIRGLEIPAEADATKAVFAIAWLTLAQRDFGSRVHLERLS